MLIFVITNSLDFSGIKPFLFSCFSLFLRLVLWGSNHTANLDLETMTVDEMKLDGRHKTPLAEWLAVTNRKRVKVVRPEEYQQIEKGENYGLFDLFQKLFELFRLRLGIKRHWNGTDGIPKNREGDFCSEYSAKRAKRPNPHRYNPDSFLTDPTMEIIGEFATKQGKGIVSGSLPLSLVAAGV